MENNKFIPKVKFVRIPLEDNIKMVCNLYKRPTEKRLTNSNRSFFNKYLGFSELMKTTSTMKDVYDCISLVVTDDYLQSLDEIAEAIKRYQKTWDLYNDEFMSALASKLNFEWNPEFPEITAYVGSFNRHPRFISDKSFASDYTLDDDTLLKHVAHECTHFLYFDKCEEELPDLNRDMYGPSWQLSELVVDPILNSPEMTSVFRDRDITHTAYSMFYNDANMDTTNAIKALYEELSIEEAMTRSYEYLLEHPLMSEQEQHTK